VIPSRDGKIREEDYGKGDAAISGVLQGWKDLYPEIASL
jgi:hypothetical protein